MVNCFYDDDKAGDDVGDYACDGEGFLLVMMLVMMLAMMLAMMLMMMMLRMMLVMMLAMMLAMMAVHAFGNDD